MDGYNLALEPERLDSNSTSSVNYLCDLGQVTYLSVPVSSSVKWDGISHSHLIAILVVGRIK